MSDRWDGIPSDVFMAILLRLPPCPRRRLRLVCRHWRGVIDERFPGKQARAMVLVFTGHCHAFIVDDLTVQRAGGGKELNLQVGADSIMVGTCNGLICLHRNSGDVVVINPATGEKLAVPPPSKSATRAPPASYSFAYHPATGLYKIVHVPCRGAFDAVSVFTLGDTSWREVPVAGGSSCIPSFGVVSVGGVTYWVAKDAHSLVSFDLKDECVGFVATLPVRVGVGQWRGLDLSWHLTTGMNGTLGFAVCSYAKKRTRTLQGCLTKAWTLEGGGRKKKTWALRYKIIEPVQQARQQIAWPYAAHDEHLLTTRVREYGGMSLHASPLGGSAWTRSVSLYPNSSRIQTFAHVETTEPLAFYRCGSDNEIDGDVEWSWKFDSGQGRWKLMLH